MRAIINLLVIICVPNFCTAQRFHTIEFYRSGYIATLNIKGLWPYDSITCFMSYKIWGTVKEDWDIVLKDSMQVSLTNRAGKKTTTQIQKDGFYELNFPATVDYCQSDSLTLAFTSPKFPVETLILETGNG